MTKQSEHAVLNHLVETCRDGERGFRLAAAQASNPELKHLFADLAAQRELFANELLPHAQRLGGDAPRDGTVIAALHRRWMKLEQAVLHDDAAIVSEVERGDRATLTAYYDAVRGMLPPDSRDVVEQQLEAIEQSHARIPVVASQMR